MDGRDKAYVMVAALFSLFFVSSLLVYITHLTQVHDKNIKRIEFFYEGELKKEQGRSNYWKGKYNNLQEQYIRSTK